MDNPMLAIPGALAIVLLLGLLLHRRRRAARQDPADGNGVNAGLLGDLDENPDGETDSDEDSDQDEDQEVAQDVVGGPDGLDEPDLVDWVGNWDVTPSEPLEPAEPDSWASDVSPGPEPVNVRYLRAQVRTLQEALVQVQDAEDTPGERTAEATFRRQVTAALRGLGERTREDESPERTLARVVAAIERLDAPDVVARPALPTVKFDLSGAQMSLAGAQNSAGPAQLAPAPAPAAAPAQVYVPELTPEMAPATAPAPDLTGSQPDAHPETDATTQFPALVTTPLAAALAAGYEDDRHEPGHGSLSGLDPFAQDEQELPPPVDPDVVLPVPPPTTHRDQRQRRWARRA